MGSSGESASSAEPVVTFSSGHESSPPDLRIVHYNDVYHLDPSSAEPVGGAARFITVCNEYRESEEYSGQPELITLFSGDAFNPSLESSITKGRHMVPILNAIGTDCATVGNHDLDFGVKQFRYLTAKCDFPWLLANVLDPALGEDVPIGNAKRTHMLTASNGIKIGIIGLGEREWLETINALPPNLIYKSATAVARELVPQLRAAGADVIVALTHMREPNDNKLAKNMGGEIDVILGGHDHFYSHSFINGTHVLRSGSDFKQLSYLEFRRRAGQSSDDSSSGTNTKWDVDIWRRDMVKSIPEHRGTVELVDRLTAKLKKSLERAVGWTTAPLDARFTTVRLRESNLGNFVCDMMRHYYQGDCAIMAAGTIRGDQIYAPGPIRLKDITDCFPFEDPVVVIRASGKAIWGSLENGVSMYPALEGRFPQVSNIKYTFDPSKAVGTRILSAEIDGRPIDPERVYKVVTRGYMARGKDGYTDLLIEPEGGDCEEVVSEENGILISMLLRQYFMALKVVRQWSNWGPSMDRHWGEVVTNVCKCHPVTQPKSRPQQQEQQQQQCTSPDTAVCVPAKRKGGWDDWSPARLRQRRGSMPLTDDADDSDEDGEDGDGDENMERELQIMRRVFKKWCRVAGVQGKVCDDLKEGEFEVEVEWTKAIAPKLEGRIKMVGEGKG